MKCHRLHVRRKIMENEENRGLISNNSYEDPLVTFVSSVLELSLYSLSLSLLDTYIFFEQFSFGSRREKKVRESKDQARNSKIK